MSGGKEFSPIIIGEYTDYESNIHEEKAKRKGKKDKRR